MRGLGSTFRRFRAGGMSSSAFSCDGSGVRDRQVAGRTGEFGGELRGELRGEQGRELRGEERSEAVPKCMLVLEQASWCGSGRCIRELGIVFGAIVLDLMRRKPGSRRGVTSSLPPAKGFAVVTASECEGEGEAVKVERYSDMRLSK